MDLCSRTGIIQVNSYEHECSAMVGTVSRNIFSLKDTHIAAYKVVVAVAVGSGSSKTTQRRKSAKVGDAVQFHIKALTDTRRTWSEDVSPRSQSSGNRYRVGIARGYGCYSGCRIERDIVRRAKMLGKQFPDVQLGLCLTGCGGQSKHHVKTSH
jgi:hypothetical protein